MIAKFAEKQMSRTFEIFIYNVIQEQLFADDSWNSFTISWDKDVLAELEKEESLHYEHDEQVPRHVLHNYVGATGINAFETENPLLSVFRLNLLVWVWNMNETNLLLTRYVASL